MLFRSAYGTNVIAAGYTNISGVPSTTNNVPFLLSLETTNGTPVWEKASTNGVGGFKSGHYSSIAVYGDKLVAVGSAYAVAGQTLNSSCLIEQWSLTGTQLLSMITNFNVGSTTYLSSVVAIESLDRAYAVGTQINANQTCDALLVEIDLSTLTVVSWITNNISYPNFTVPFPSTNLGKAITTDGVDLYVAVEGPGEGIYYQDRQAAVFRYRAKKIGRAHV